MKVLVLKGGVSAEREVSLISGANVAEALEKAGFEVRQYDIRKLEITEDMKWADVVYPVLHGGFGEDGRLQKMLEDANIPFVGCSSKACEIAMDKIESKKVMDQIGIGNARYAVITDANEPVPAHLQLPLIVKPNREGSTFGLTLVEKPEDWSNALTKALTYDDKVLVEEYIQGIESTVGVLLGKPLPLVEIHCPGKLYDYDAKYTHAAGETQYLCPPQHIPEHLQQKAQEAAIAFAREIHAETLLRVDVIIRLSDEKIFVLEGNALPGCTESSLLPKAAAVAGIDFVSLCSGLVRHAQNK